MQILINYLYYFDVSNFFKVFYMNLYSLQSSGGGLSVYFDLYHGKLKLFLFSSSLSKLQGRRNQKSKKRKREDKVSFWRDGRWTFHSCAWLLILYGFAIKAFGGYLAHLGTKH